MCAGYGFDGDPDWKHHARSEHPALGYEGALGFLGSSWDQFRNSGMPGGAYNATPAQQLKGRGEVGSHLRLLAVAYVFKDVGTEMSTDESTVCIDSVHQAIETLEAQLKFKRGLLDELLAEARAKEEHEHLLRSRSVVGIATGVKGSASYGRRSTERKGGRR